jgi:hypothetical protein
MSDLKTSLLVNRQVPEFVREEYPLFITFLEAYYEFLETQQGTQKNDLTAKAKSLRDVSDVDASIDEFETNFFNNYAALIPKNVEVDKAFLIKNVLPLYLAKGNESAFKLLFRMLFNDEVDILLPKNNILRASDGKWTIDNILKLETDVRSLHVANGNTSPTASATGNTTFILAQQVDADDIEVYVNDVIQTEVTDFFIRKETRKLVFNTAPAANSVIKVVYNDFNIELLNNRQITGDTSGATAIVERAVPRIITDQLNFGLPFELFINNKTITGSFVNGEAVSTTIIDADENLINLEADTFSILTKINVIDGGSGYNIADPVVIVGGGADIGATAEVEDISTGYTNRIVVNYGGSGFKAASIVSSIGLPTLITGAVDAVNTAHYSANTYIITDDIIANYASINISDPDYGFPGPYTENSATRIVDALTPLEVTGLGPMTNVVVLFSNTSVNTTSLDSEGAIYQAGNNFFDIKSFRSVGRIDVLNSGTNYTVGDEVIFGANPSGTYGFGAAAAVRTINVSTGAVQSIAIEPPRISGTANILNNSAIITGTGTSFDTDLQVGDRIIISGQSRFVNAISSPTSANVNVAFTFTDGTIFSNNRFVGSYSKGIVGGVNYTQNNFPTVTISSNTGTSANIAITSLMGDGESLEAFSDTVAGQILSIKLTSGGIGYEYIPQVDLTNSGDGNATANAVVGSSYVTLPGRWTTSDSILSSAERKLQGANYYVEYSYVTSSLTEFSRYKEVLRQLLHPAGMINYADLNKEVTSNADNVITTTIKTTDVSGLISVTNGSVFVTGTNTKFNIANTNGVITIGSNVAVNGEIRTIDSIISNTNLSVSVAFTTNSSAQTLIVVT